MKKFANLLPNYWLAETPQPLGKEAWQAVGGKGADFRNPLERFQIKKCRQTRFSSSLPAVSNDSE
ncbi:hypothetical protein [Peribacillus frigoritolerans]|uniref:Uncharacterized protein n=1 Tax=Peribacillus castrilensis TaxID=2897690 RepID=A0AAW9NBQ6_9BACI|nr:hypothetical protein [Peribacillus castrilensis]